MKVTYLKPHNGNKPGDTEDLNESLANYLIRCKIVELAKEIESKESPKKGRKAKESKDKVETKELKEDLETK